MRFRCALAALLLYTTLAVAQQEDSLEKNSAGYVPVITGGMGYTANINGGVPALEPQINPVLLLPLRHNLLLESRTDFVGFFQRKNLTDGPYTGKVTKTVEFAELDWLIDSHVTVVGGRYILPFGLYNERLSPYWIRAMQDFPITAVVGTRTSGSGDGLMLRGVATQHPGWSLQYTAYFSANSSVNQLGSARTAGGDVSLYLPTKRLEIGTSYQRFLQDRQINSEAAYVSWQPTRIPLDIKGEFDQSYYGRGYWLESAYMMSNVPVAHKFFQNLQVAARIQQFFPDHGGGNSLPRVDTQKFDVEMNYYLRDDLRLVSSYGRQFSSQGNLNVWNVGFTHRFMWPLWPGRKK